VYVVSALTAAAVFSRKQIAALAAETNNTTPSIALQTRTVIPWALTITSRSVVSCAAIALKKALKNIFYF
jgi:hypothetical protein